MPHLQEYLGLFNTDAPPVLAGHASPTWWRTAAGGPWRAYLQAPGAPTPDWTPLEPLLRIDGASAGSQPAFHYVVETDVPIAAEADFNAWYDTEHMPGLARVDGTVLARRYRRLRGGPRYIACYDLLTPDAMSSAAWLAVRHTPWSDRVRPTFMNTQRTLYVRAPGAPA